MASLDTRRLETFILARLLIRPKTGLGLRDVRRQLWPFVSHMLSNADWRKRLSAIVAQLREAKLVDPRNLNLTDAGKAEILLRLSLVKPPTHANWQAFMAEAVVPAAMGLNPETARLNDADDLVAALLAREFRLQVKGKATLTKVLNALVWKAIGVDSDEKLNGGALQRAILQQHLSGSRVKEPERLARMLASKISGSRSAGANPARQAILRDWLSGGTKRKPEADKPAAADSLTRAETMKIESFAEAALHAARDPETIRFGDHKAFIDSVFERYVRGNGQPSMALAQFKKKLVAAHRKGLLTLARADLVEAMDPERVAASETHYLNSTFHFVEAD